MFREGSTVGPYTLVKKLGSGSFGAVWLAERVTRIATTKVALKVPLGDEINIEAITQEATTWVQASGHPNVVPIIEANIYDEQVVIASEYIDSGSLENWLARNGGKAPSIESAIEISCGILSGLEHLHSRQIIHRDIKPANLLLQGETPRLVDFGISRVLRNTSRSIMAAGTPSYMAPEAFDGKRNEQTDLWSVGVILYQMLAGRLPFPQQDMTALIAAIVSHNPEPMPTPLPGPLQAVVNRSLAKDLSKRFRNATEMRAALRNAADLMRQNRHHPPPQPKPQPAGGGTIVETPAMRQQQQQATRPAPQPLTGQGGATPAPTIVQGPVPTVPRGGHQPTMVGQHQPTMQAPNQFYQPSPVPQFGMGRAKKNNTQMIIIAAVAGVLLLGGIITAIILMSKGSSNTNSGGGGGGGTNRVVTPAEPPNAVAQKIFMATDVATVQSNSARGYEQIVASQMGEFYASLGGYSWVYKVDGENIAGENAQVKWSAYYAYTNVYQGSYIMRFKIEGGAWKATSGTK